MKHRFGHRKFGMTSSHRRAMLRNMANALVRHEQIRTTVHRAKELRGFVEPLMTRGKHPTVANRRLVFSRLRDRASVVKIFDDLGERFAARPGGYTRIVKDGFRRGDNAPMAIMQLVEAPRPMVDDLPEPPRLDRDDAFPEPTPTPAESDPEPAKAESEPESSDPEPSTPESSESEPPKSDPEPESSESEPSTPESESKPEPK